MSGTEGSGARGQGSGDQAPATSDQRPAPGDQSPATLPPAIVAMVRDAAGERAEAVLAGMMEARLPAFRANTLRGRVTDLKAELTAAGVPFAPHPLSDWSFTTTPEGERLLKATPAYTEGRLYSQGLASQLPALLGTLRPGMRVLDACAAPGGKATLLAMRLGEGGRGLTACERAAVRFQKLEHILRLQGADRVRALHCDTREPPEAVARSRWDHILIDAPCSGSGMIDGDPCTWPHLVEDYDGYVATRARIQRALAERAAALLKRGGTLVYSTCSLDPREDEAVAVHLLRLRAPLKPVDLSAWARRFPGTSGPGVPAFRGETYPPELTAACLRLWPCARHEGFFVAMFRA